MSFYKKTLSNRKSFYRRVFDERLFCSRFGSKFYLGDLLPQKKL